MSEDGTTLAIMLFSEMLAADQSVRGRLTRVLPKGMEISHFSVLNHLIRVNDGPTPLALSRAFQVPKNSMTHTLSGLEKAGLVALKPNPSDGRSKQVWLTQEGRDFREAAVAQLVPDMLEMADALEGFDYGAVVTQLAVVRSYLDAARD